MTPSSPATTSIASTGVDLQARNSRIVNAGHPWPLRLRHGRVEEIALAIDLPFGLKPGTSFQLQAFPLEPGDRIIFLTDGLFERNSADLDVHSLLVRTAGLHPREVVHALGEAVLRATEGDLRDDATVCAWTGTAGHRGTVIVTADRALSTPRRSGRRRLRPHRLVAPSRAAGAATQHPPHGRACNRSTEGRHAGHPDPLPRHDRLAGVPTR